MSDVITAAAGVISLPEHYLRETLAACTHWAAWTGLSAEQSKERIFYGDIPAPANDADSHQAAERQLVRPFAIISTATGKGLTSRRLADGYYDEQGRLELSLEWDVPPHLARDSAEVNRQFNNHVGRLLRRTVGEDSDFVGLLDLAYQPGYLAIDQVVYSGPYDPPEALRVGMGHYVVGFLEIIWGGNG